MKNKYINNRGFSLIELLAVITIIGIVAIIAIPSVSQYINNASDTAYVSYERSMVDAAKSRIIQCETETNPDKKCNLRLPYTTSGAGSYLNITLNDLVNEGFMDPMKDPESNNYCNLDSYVRVTLDPEHTGNYNYKACLTCGDFKSVGC